MKRFSAKALLIVLMAIATFCFIGCASAQQAQLSGTYDLPYEAAYELVGYKFLYSVDNNSLTFNYLDVMSDAEIQKAAKTIATLLPEVASYEVTGPGQMTFKLSANPSREQFDAFVTAMNKLIYQSIYK